jgi:hypothetical protein
MSIFIVSEANPGPAIHDYLVKHLAELGRHPNVERCGVGRDNLMRLVTLGRGLTLTSEATTGTSSPVLSVGQWRARSCRLVQYGRCATTTPPFGAC